MLVGGLQQRFGSGSVLSSALSSFGEAILVPTPCLGVSSRGNKQLQEQGVQLV